jgi:hypothetical protein
VSVEQVTNVRLLIGRFQRNSEVRLAPENKYAVSRIRLSIKSFTILRSCHAHARSIKNEAFELCGIGWLAGGIL